MLKNLIKNFFKIQWSGIYPNYCFGRYSVKINGQNIPVSIKGPLFTGGRFRHWYINDNSNDGYYYYYCKKSFASWCKSDIALNLFNTISGHLGRSLSNEEIQSIYSKCKKIDWRHGQCGGCI